MKISREVQEAIDRAASDGRVTERAVQRSENVSFELPLPPSTNQLFANEPGKGRVKTSLYRAWIASAASHLMLQRVKPVASPVAITITLDGKVHRGRDLGNVEKAVTDLLVSQGIIAGDNLMHVRRILLEYAPGPLEPVAVVEVQRILGGQQ